jgi:hypothetical protein
MRKRRRPYSLWMHKKICIYLPRLLILSSSQLVLLCMPSAVFSVRKDTETLNACTLRPPTDKSRVVRTRLLLRQLHPFVAVHVPRPCHRRKQASRRLHGRIHRQTTVDVEPLSIHSFIHTHSLTYTHTHIPDEDSPPRVYSVGALRSQYLCHYLHFCLPSL